MPSPSPLAVPLTLALALALTLPLALTLTRLENVLVREGGGVALCDFGSASAELTEVRVRLG